MSANRWKLPTSLRVGQKDRPIRSDFANGLECMIALQDPELDEVDRADVCCRLIYGSEQAEELYAEGLTDEAILQAFTFLGRSNGPEAEREDAPDLPTLVHWETDAPMIFDAINKGRQTDIRETDLHWWTFLGLYMEIGQSLFATVLSLRQKLARGVKLDKEERRFVNENPQFFPEAGGLSKEDEEEIFAMLGRSVKEKQ